MTAPATPVRYPLQLPISDWLFIDATMEHHIRSSVDGTVPSELEDRLDMSAATDPDLAALPKVARLGFSVRRAGWAQIPGWPHDAEGFTTWPAPGQTAPVTLAGAQWSLIVHALHHWADVDERLADTETAARSRAIAADVSHRLAAQGWSPGSR
ncbi:hypothetical protein Dvina_15425 [Dactylosporangium vinaceum]|uniref:DinB family protein n=1 Tax=Dactylosporangium vinaceum TaxID=53362 RepID=A0ABV5M217_9ACTN|nr:hypothetical protein [Dactylosporangium vinaceum]UAB99342.1 hypothetical protein Dvina_15425 [Dactylosporangium vinaceum]